MSLIDQGNLFVILALIESNVGEPVGVLSESNS